MQIAYFINRYPAVSHTFIRRELCALEAEGVSVLRIALRADRGELVDAADLDELPKVQFLLRQGAHRFLDAFLRCFVQRPFRFLTTLGISLRQGWGSKSGLRKHVVYFVEACLLKQMLRTAGVEHVHAHFGTNTAHVVMFANMLGGPPYSFTVHGPEEFDDVSGLVLRDKIAHASFVAGVSSFGRSQLFRHCDHHEWSKIHVVRCGLPVDYAQDAPDVELQENRLVCVGRLCEQKGQLLLVEAAKRLRDESIDVEVVLVGDGPMRAEIEEFVKRHSLREVVRLVGSQSGLEVKRQILASRAMVLPSFAEGLPVVLMEALALRRPVVTTYVAGIPELVDQDCGWLVPAGDIPSLVDAMRKAIETPLDKIQIMGDHGARRVARYHNVEIEAGKLSALFRSSALTEQHDAVGV